MLRCVGLRKTYRTPRGAVDAVRGVDVALAAGRYAAIIGRSGSGKSSLLAMIGGLSRPSGGTVAIDGTDLWALGEAARSRFCAGRIGYVFQFASLLPTLTALDNVALPVRLAGGADPFSRAAALLEEVGLAAHAGALPTELSAGEQRRVAVARALVNAPPLLLADEPTSDLDEQTEREVMALLLAAHARGTTVVLVTHNLQLAAGAEEVLHIADGEAVP